jgi:ankyrin repeat protein
MDIILFLLEKGKCDYNTKNEEGVSALDFALDTSNIGWC